MGLRKSQTNAKINVDWSTSELVQGDNPSFVTLLPGTHRVHEFVITQDDVPKVILSCHRNILLSSESLSECIVSSGSTWRVGYETHVLVSPSISFSSASHIPCILSAENNYTLSEK